MIGRKKITEKNIHIIMQFMLDRKLFLEHEQWQISYLFPYAPSPAMGKKDKMDSGLILECQLTAHLLISIMVLSTASVTEKTALLTRSLYPCTRSYTQYTTQAGSRGQTLPNTLSLRARWIRLVLRLKLRNYEFATKTCHTQRLKIHVSAVIQITPCENP